MQAITPTPRDCCAKFATGLCIIVKNPFLFNFLTRFDNKYLKYWSYNFVRLCSPFWIATWTCPFKLTNILMTISWLISFCFISMRRVKRSLVLELFECSLPLFIWRLLKLVNTILSGFLPLPNMMNWRKSTPTFSRNFSYKIGKSRKWNFECFLA